MTACVVFGDKGKEGGLALCIKHIFVEKKIKSSGRSPKIERKDGSLHLWSGGLKKNPEKLPVSFCILEGDLHEMPVSLI